MFKIFLFSIFLFLSFFNIQPIFAKGENFVSIVNPIRGNEFWEMQNQKADEVVKGEAQILKQYHLPSTWLLRFDAFENQDILQSIEKDEKGLFLEVTPSWAQKAGVLYHASASWHQAGSAFLTGYEPKEREKLIDAIFEKYKSIFNTYPKSVGAWWIDSYSLNYMQEKYGIIAALIVSDQYSTDNYQIWGQYFSTPYYPDKKNALHPAQSTENKIPLVISQWAPRDPLNAYGNGVFESTFSVQPNDYLDFHKLDINYFSKLVNLYTSQNNEFNSLVVGLENTYDWSKYKDEYKKQIELLSKNRNIKVATLQDFSSWYLQAFPNLSPSHLISANDPLGSYKKVVWFMNPYYRVGWFYNQDGSVVRDIRQYIEGEEELCLQKRCDSVNFATSATRVLDEVSFGHKWLIDQGKIKDFKIEYVSTNPVISYVNQAGRLRTIEFLPRDIKIDEKAYSIDTAILSATSDSQKQKKVEAKPGNEGFQLSSADALGKLLKFLIFLIAACLIPGIVLTNKIFEKNTPFFQRMFLSSVVGLTFLTLVFYMVSLLNLKWLVLLYLFVNLMLFTKLKLYSLRQINFPKFKNKFNFALVSLISAGTIFQTIPTFKSGLIFSYGMGFWGPNTHDGVWHIALINQLIKSTPPQSPIFSGTILKNYHYLYDLLVAGAHFSTDIPVSDLVFRFFPIIFSLLLGIGSYFLFKTLFEKRLGEFKTKIAVLFSLYLIYFAGSFGWIVEFIKQRHLGGESAFWANQSISYNLNPPFAVSLIIIVALLQILVFYRNSKTLVIFLFTVLAGCLISFKAYGGILILLSLFLMAVYKIIVKKDFQYILIFLISIIFSAILFMLNFEPNKASFIFAPFWFVHSMVDSPDRVGWERLSLAREVGFAKPQWFKYFTAEAISLVIFILGNLGVRFLSFGLIFKIKKIFSDDSLLLIFIFLISSLIIPLLFIQSGNPWNTIQFLYYYLYISALFSGVVFCYLWVRFPKILILPILLVMVIISPINSIVTAESYFSYLPHAKVSHNELKALDFLAKQKEGVVLAYPYDKNLKQKIAEPWPLFAYDSTAYVSALSKKAVYMEDEPQNQIFQNDYKLRQILAKDFFQSPSAESLKFLKGNKIKYIFLPKIFNNLEQSGGVVKPIYSNDEVSIYEIIGI